MKKLMLILGIIFAFCLMVNSVRATGVISFTYDIPTNNSFVYVDSAVGGTLGFQITINDTVNTSCQMMWMNNGTLFTMTSADADVNTTWYYNWTTPSAYLNGNLQNARFRCGNVTKTWSNATSILYYKLKDSTSYQFVDKVIANNSIKSSIPNLNISTYDNATNCTYTYNNVAGLMTQSPNRLFWTNASALSWSSSAFGVQHNITYSCKDSCGNTTTSGRYFFKLDTSYPKIGAPTFDTIGNASGGNYVHVNFSVTDNNPLGCNIRLYWEDGSIVNVSTNLAYPTDSSTNNCSVNITPSDITKDGYVTLVASANDAAGNRNISMTNQSYIFYRMKTGWNLITGFENKTLAQIAGEFPSVTYVSVWDNTYNSKVFRTFTIGGSTNANIRANFTSIYGYGGTYIYISEDIISMRRYYTPVTSWLNATLYGNTTTNSSWNIVGVHKRITNLNASIVGDYCLNGTLQDDSSCQQIAWVSWYSIQLGKYCSFYRNRLATSCSGYLSNNITLERGDAIWISLTNTVTPNNNITLERNKW